LDIGLLLIIAFIVLPLVERLIASGRKGQDDQQTPMPPGQQRPGGQGRMPTQPRRLPPDEEEQTPFRSVPASHGEDESAASVLPDDLWEILTGERRPPAHQPTPQQPTPRPTGRVESAERPPIDAEPPRPIDRPAPPPIDRRPADVAHRRERAQTQRPPRDTTPRGRERPPVVLRDRAPRERDPERMRASRPASSADKYVRPEHVRAERVEHVRAERVEHVRAERVVTSHDDNILGKEERRDRFHERLDRSAAAAAAARAAAGPEPHVYRFTDEADLRRAIVMAEVLGPPKALQD
jgi:hypothetical protein